MSETTYFLDLKNTSIIRSINNRLANMDTSLRRFPQTGYQLLRSSNVTSYNDAEWNVQKEILETGSVINTGDGTDIFVTGRGTTDWTNSSIQMKYSKYSTGKFDAEFIVNLSGTSGFDFSDSTYEFWNYVFLIPIYLIKNVYEDSIQVTSYSGNSSCWTTWRVPGVTNKWYGGAKPYENAFLCLQLQTGSEHGQRNINITNGKIRLSGSYNMNLDNA